MPDFEVDLLLDTAAVAVRHVRCAGTCRHRSAEECVSATHLVFPCRGTYLRHVGSDHAAEGLLDAGPGHVVPHSSAQSGDVVVQRTLPLFARFQKPLALVPGMVGTAQVDEVLLVCRRD